MSTFLEMLEEQGKRFYHRKLYTVANGSSMKILIDYTKHTSDLGHLFVEPVIVSAHGGAVYVNVYAGTTYAPTTAMSFFPTNTTKGTSLETEVKYTIATSTTPDGYVIESSKVGEDSSTPLYPSGGESSAGFHIQVDNTSNGLIDIINSSGSSVEITVLMEMYEF